MQQNQPLKTFIIYSNKDTKFKNDLVRHFSTLKRNGLIDVWHDGDILPSENWQEKIEDEIKNTQLFVYLVSTNALNSEFIQNTEIKRALKSSSSGVARVIPIVVSPCAWEDDPDIKRLNALPVDNGKCVPVDQWKSGHDAAWTEAVKGIKKQAEKISNIQKAEEKEAVVEIFGQQREGLLDYWWRNIPHKRWLLGLGVLTTLAFVVKQNFDEVEKYFSKKEVTETISIRTATYPHAQKVLFAIEEYDKHNFDTAYSILKTLATDSLAMSPRAYYVLGKIYLEGFGGAVKDEKNHLSVFTCLPNAGIQWVKTHWVCHLYMEMGAMLTVLKGLYG